MIVYSSLLGLCKWLFLRHLTPLFAARGGGANQISTDAHFILVPPKFNKNRRSQSVGVLTVDYYYYHTGTSTLDCSKPTMMDCERHTVSIKKLYRN